MATQIIVDQNGNFYLFNPADFIRVQHANNKVEFDYRQEDDQWIFTRTETNPDTIIRKTPQLVEKNSQES